jgi:hypothetical protein
MISACGIELSTDTEVCSVAMAGREDGARRYQVDLLYYGPSAGAIDAAGAAVGSEESLGAYADPMQIAGLLDDLRNAGVWLHLLTAVEVASASYVFKQAVRGRKIKTSGHEALKSALQYATRRPLAAAFAFERRKVPADMSPLNAASFALYGVRRNEDIQAGVWFLPGPPTAPGLVPLAGIQGGPGLLPSVPSVAPAASQNGDGERYAGPPLGWPIEE